MKLGRRSWSRNKHARSLFWGNGEGLSHQSYLHQSYLHEITYRIKPMATSLLSMCSESPRIYRLGVLSYQNKNNIKSLRIINGCLVRDYSDNEPTAFFHFVSKDCHHIPSTKLLVPEPTPYDAKLPSKRIHLAMEGGRFLPSCLNIRPLH